MANPRQRRKARSSTHRPVSHSRNAQRNLKKTPPIRGPKVLQDAWDNRKTVRQNYAALGLVHNLNPSGSGGTEVIEDAAGALPETPVDITAEETPSALISHLNEGSASTFTAPLIPKGHGRIIRDESGNVVGVQLAEEDEQKNGTEDATDGDVDMESLEPEIPQGIKGKWVTDLGKQRGHPAKVGKVVEALELISTTTKLNSSGNSTTLSASLSGVGPRHASKGETMYLHRLVDKYGLGDSAVAAMARDRKLNSEQRTEGQLSRALKRAGFI